MAVEGRRYAGYNVYKSKGAINIKIISPTWTQLQGGSSYQVTKEGGLLFEFAPAAANPREYDWGKKSTFFLDATECGEVLDKVFNNGCEFVHDPGAQSPTAGQVSKRMKFSPTPDKKGVFVSLSVSDRANAQASSSLSVPMSFGEVNVLDNIIRFSIPRFLGMDKSFGEPGIIYFGGQSESMPTPPPPPSYKAIE
jgi:hypothetical protein